MKRRAYYKTQVGKRYRKEGKRTTTYMVKRHDLPFERKKISSQERRKRNPARYWRAPTVNHT